MQKKAIAPAFISHGGERLMSFFSVCDAIIGYCLLRCDSYLEVVFD